jgi:hypothetical protein
MTAAPDIFQRAASFDWETLLPVVFFVLYGLAQFLGSRKKTGDEEAGEEPEVDPMERARQIREEIRRKIEARKEQQGAERGAPVHETEYRPHYDPNLPDTQQPRPVISRESTPPRPQPRPAQRSVVLKEVDRESSNLPVPDFEKRLKEQQVRLAESRRRQQEAMAQTRRMKEQTRPKHRKTLLKPVESATTTAAVASPARLRREILIGLRDPSTLRRAVLYREILDPPVGLR